VNEPIKCQRQREVPPLDVFTCTHKGGFCRFAGCQDVLEPDDTDLEAWLVRFSTFVNATSRCPTKVEMGDAPGQAQSADLNDWLDDFRG